PAAPPSGCRFHTRCPWRQPTRCDDERPELRPLADGPGGGPVSGAGGIDGGAHRVACHYAEQIESGELRPHDVSPEVVPEGAGLPSAPPPTPASITEVLGH
ncbi:MAG TPA: hypothetical protein VK735_03900, partial [Pseudonocardia sp.]|nr:hypothetical protein [Pseudonocardia sp.]